MLKKLIFTAFLACFALSANAQIATPQLDAGFHTYGGAAAGWRYGSTVNLTGITGEGKVKSDSTEVGDVKVGLNAKGPDDSSNSLPFLFAAYRGEMIGAEFYSNIGDGLKTDVEIDGITGLNKYNIYSEEKEMRINLAYVIGETISIGLGYSSVSNKSKTEYEVPTVRVYDNESEVTTTGTSVTASFRLADIFFLAAGMEAVSETGTVKQNVVVDVASEYSSVDADYADNSWTNTLYGLGFMMGDPDQTQFRAEYSVISSPESEQTESGKVDSSHPQTTTTFISAEVKYGNLMAGYLNETENQAKLNDVEQEAVTTSFGVGWQPMEGLTFSLYALDYKVTKKDSKSEQVFNPTGYRFFVGYNF